MSVLFVEHSLYVGNNPMDNLDTTVSDSNLSGIKVGPQEIAELQRLEKSLYDLWEKFNVALVAVHEIRSNLRKVNIEIQYPTQPRQPTVIDI